MIIIQVKLYLTIQCKMISGFDGTVGESDRMITEFGKTMNEFDRTMIEMA